MMKETSGSSFATGARATAVSLDTGWAATTSSVFDDNRKKRAGGFYPGGNPGGIKPGARPQAAGRRAFRERSVEGVVAFDRPFEPVALSDTRGAGGSHRGGQTWLVQEPQQRRRRGSSVA